VKERNEAGVGATKAKAEFRLDWAKRQHASIVSTSSHSKVWEDVDIQMGEYVCFAMLVEANGFTFDPDGAVRRAAHYADCCLHLGGFLLENGKLC